MGLPKIDQPLFPITIPSTNKKLKFRPFTVKEEKILLVAQESKDLEQIMIAIKQVLGNCVEGLDVDNMPMFDLEYLILNIRAKAVGDVIKFTVKDPDTEEEVNLEINIADVKIKKNEGHSKTINLGDAFVITMKYPSVDQIVSLRSNEMSATSYFKLLGECIESLFDVKSESAYVFSEYTEKEVEDFLEGLSSSDVKQLETFFNTIPVIRIEAPYKNKNGEKKTFVLEGVESFFM